MARVACLVVSFALVSICTPRAQETIDVVHRVRDSAAHRGTRDPQLGPTTPMRAQDVAYSPETDRFLAVVAAVFPDRGIIGYLLDGAGTQLAVVDIFDVFPGEVHNARVAYVAARRAFVVTWWFECELCAESVAVAVVSAQTGEVTSIDTRVGTLVTMTSAPTVDVSGEATQSGSAAMVVWHDVSQTLRGRSVQIDASLEMSLGPTVVLRTGLKNVTRVQAADDGGRSGRRLIVVDHGPQSAKDVDGVVVDRDLQVLDAGPIVQNAARSEHYPAVDGDGEQWLVAYELDGAVACIPVFWSDSDGSAHVGAVSPLAAAPARWPTVTWIGDTYLVSYAIPQAPQHTDLLSVDAFACVPCGAAVTVWSGPGSNAAPGSAVVRTGARERVLVIDGGQGGQFVDVVDGDTQDLGGGCGDGGRAAAACAIAGNASFGFALRDARAGTPAFLALSAGRADVPCGTCTLVPHLGLGLIVGAGNTDTYGNAALAVPLPPDPGLIGATLYEQWLVLGGTGCLNAIDLSSALGVTLQ